MSGRKSLKDEIEVVRYMTELAPKTFAVLKECLEGDLKKDKLWAAEQMIKLYGKAIPTEVVGEGGGPLKILFDKALNDGQSPETTSGANADSGEQSSV